MPLYQENQTLNALGRRGDARGAHQMRNSVQDAP